MRVGPIASNVLLPPVKHQLDRSVCLSRQVCCDNALIASAELRAETAAHVLGNDSDLALGQLEDVGELVPNARCALSRGVDRNLIRLPVDDEAVCFECGVRLHLREILALNNHVRLSEALLYIANVFPLRAVNIALLWNALRSAASARAASGISRPWEDHRSIVGARVGAVD